MAVWKIVSVFRARAAGRFGSRLTVRFLLLFALMRWCRHRRVFGVGRVSRSQHRVVV
jgi:hypothetical protein